MLKTLLKAVGLLVSLAYISFVNAATMSGINVSSALGHPLKAEISLAELGKTDKSTLSAKLASINEFKSVGIDYPYALPKLTFEVSTRANGQVYIKLTSTQPVNEPFVSLLVELSWPSGKLLREYTFLLDPASFVPEQPKLAEVKPVEPVVPVQAPIPVSAPEIKPAVAAVAPEPVVEAVPVQAEPMVAALPVEEKSQPVEADPADAAKISDMEKAEMVAAEAAPAEPARAEAGKVESGEAVKMEPLAPAGLAGADSLMVEKGDTLGKIADSVKPVDVSLERMLVAMYRANVKTFDGQNMNRIRAGKILRMPELVEIEQITQKAAIKEIRAQVADWQDYRQKLAATQGDTSEQAPKQQAAGKISAAVAEKAPVIKDTAKEVLRLSKGESLGDKTIVGGSSKNSKESQIAKADDAAAKNKQLQEEKMKIAKLEEINKDASKLVELKGQAPTKLSGEEKKPESGLPPVVVPATTEPVSPDTDIVAVILEYLDKLLADPILLGGAVAVLLGLGGLGYVMLRRNTGGQKKSNKKNDEVGAATGSWRTPITPSPDTGDFTRTSTPAAAPMSVAAALDDVDPISEADLFLNFGRDAQAEEILKDALVKNPANSQVKLKLLSIYVNRKDSRTFSKYALEIKDSGDTAAWERVLVMGREVDPDNPTYSDAKGGVRQRETPKAEVDFDLGLKSGVMKATTPATSKDFKMDFDLSATQTSVFSEPVDLSTAFAKPSAVSQARTSADVDATSILSREVVNTAQNVSPMDFDVSGILPGEVKNIAKTSAMDFDLTGSQPINMSQKAGAAPSMNFEDLVFEIPANKAKVEEKPQPPMKGGLAFALDIPTKTNYASNSNNPEITKVLDMNFGDININLDDEGSPARAGGEGKDEQWHEVATKLDLAKAYQEMGDADGAKEILEEVIRDGDDAQRESAQKLRQQMTA